MCSAQRSFLYVDCDGEIGHKRLPAQKLSFGYVASGHVQVVVCGWQIPADAGGKKLRLWDYGGGNSEHRVRVGVGNAEEKSVVYVWGAKKP